MKSILRLISFICLGFLAHGPVIQGMEQPETEQILSEKAEAQSCCICLENLDESSSNSDEKITTSCNHSFHFKCIDPWTYTTETQAKTCPFCRTAFSKKTIEAILSTRLACAQQDQAPHLLKRVNVKNGEYFFENDQALLKAMKNPFNKWHQDELDNLTKQGRIEFTDYHLERAEQEIQQSQRGGDLARADRFKDYIEKVRRLQSKNSFSGFLKYHCPRLYTLGETLYNPLLYGLAGLGISHATGFNLEKGFFLGASAGAFAKLLSTSNALYSAEVNEQRNNRSWHLPITGFFKKHTMKYFLLFGIVGLSANKFFHNSTSIPVTLSAALFGTSSQRLAAWALG